AARGLAEPKLGGEKADDVEPKLRVAARVVRRIRRIAPREIEDHFARIRGNHGEPELAVFILRAKTLPCANPRHPAKPRHEVRAAHAGELKRERDRFARRHGDPKFPWASR